MGLVVEGMGLVVYGRSYGVGSRRCMSIINFNGIYKIRQTKIKIKCAFTPLVCSNLLLLPRPLLALLPSSTLFLPPFHVPTSLDPSIDPPTSHPSNPTNFKLMAFLQNQRRFNKKIRSFTFYLACIHSFIHITVSSLTPNTLIFSS